jgi:trimeric autotransporter adhesin
MWFLTLLFGSLFGEKFFASLSEGLFDLGRWFDNLLGITKSAPQTIAPVAPPWSLTTAQIAALTTAQVQALTPAQIASLTTDQIQAFTTTGISVFLTSQLQALNTADIAALTTDQIVALTTTQIPFLPTSSVVALTTDQIAAMEIEDVESLTQIQVMALTTAQIVALTTDQFPTLSTNEIAALSTAQVRAIETQDLVTLSTSQVVAFTTQELSAFTTEQAKALTTDQRAALTSAQLAALPFLGFDIPTMTTAEIAALTSAQLITLTTDQIVSLSTAQAMVLSTNAVQALRTDQAVAFETEDLAALTTGQIEALTSKQTMVFSTTQVEAFTSQQIPAFTTEAYQYLTTGTPIILDLNGDGVRTLGINAGVKFDLFDDGAAINTGWVSSGDGLLVLDRNHDGLINDGSELFGSATRLANGEKASDGYAALREYDTNGDGVIDIQDAIYGDLRIWIDSNSDGVSGAGEVKTLAELGIAKINLNAVAGSEVDNGNWLGLTSSYDTTDGATHDMADVWFRAQKQAVSTASNVDEAIAALNTASKPMPSMVVEPVVAPLSTIPEISIRAQPAVEPLQLISAIRTQVSGMAQTMGSFVDAEISQSELAPADGTTKIASPSPVALAVTSLADAMKQFDTNGAILLGQSPLGAAPTTTLKFAGAQNPAVGDVLLEAHASK